MNVPVRIRVRPQRWDHSHHRLCLLEWVESTLVIFDDPSFGMDEMCIADMAQAKLRDGEITPLWTSNLMDDPDHPRRVDTVDDGVRDAIWGLHRHMKLASAMGVALAPSFIPHDFFEENDPWRLNDRRSNWRGPQK